MKMEIFRNFAGFPINRASGEIHAIFSARKRGENRDEH